MLLGLDKPAACAFTKHFVKLAVFAKGFIQLGKIFPCVCRHLKDLRSICCLLGRHIWISHHQVANWEIRLRHIAPKANRLANLRAIWPSHTTFGKTLTAVSRRNTATHAVSCLVIVNCLVSAGIDPNRLWVFLLDLIGHEANMGVAFRVTLVFEGVDWQSVVRLADLFDVVLQTAIREEGTLLGRCGGRARKRASPHGDVCQELRDLEWVAHLLLELIDQSIFASLLCLLHLRACAQLCASNAQHAVCVGHTGVYGLIITLAENVRHGRTHRQVLLVCKVRCGHASAVTTKCARLNCSAKSARLRLFVCLLHLGARRVGHVLDERVHVSIDTLVCWPHVGHAVYRVNALQLLWVELCNKVRRLRSILLERVLGNLLGLRVHSVVSGEDFLGNLHLVR